MASATATPTPAITAPPGQVTNYNAVNDLAFWNALTQGLALGITGVLWFSRLYVRAFVKRIWEWEDSFAVLSFFCLVSYSAFTTTIVSCGGGQHEWNITNTQIYDILYYVNLAQIFYGITAAVMKTTILMLYIRIFSPTPWSRFNIAIKALILVIDVFYLGNTFAKIFQCWPREKIWDSSTPGSCINLPILLDVSGFFNCFSDIIILLVPIKGLWALKISRMQKLGIYVVFTVGIVGPVFSLIGFIQRFQRASSNDQSFNQLVILLWATAELAAGMMIVCLPTIPGMFQRRRQNTDRSIGGQNNSMPMSPRSRNSKFGLPHYSSQSDNAHFVGNNYFELIDNKADLECGEYSAKNPQDALNRYAGGKNDVSVHVDQTPSSGHTTPDGAIRKTITVQQSRH